MIDFSWILATIRPDFDEYIYKTIDSIINCPNNPYSYEIILVSPFDIPRQYDKVKYVKEEISRGAVAASNLSASHAVGEYLGGVPCDWQVQPNWFRIIDFMKEKNLQLSTFRSCLHNGVSFPNAPCMHRSLYEGLLQNHYFNPAFQYNYVDNDLGLKCHEMGIPCPQCPYTQAIVRTWEENEREPVSKALKRKYNKIDEVVFNRIWKGKYPPFLFNPACDYTDEEVQQMADERMKLSLWQ